MARHSFGGGIADWTFTRVDEVDGNDNLAQLAGAAVVTFWNLESGGSQYTDLIDPDGAPASQILSSDGSDGRPVGQIPPFLGPEDVWVMWASANGGPRVLMTATDLGATVQQLLESTEGS